MARGGGSFSFAKRQKELKRMKKKQEKLERRRSAKLEAQSMRPSGDPAFDEDPFPNAASANVGAAQDNPLITDESGPT